MTDAFQDIPAEELAELLGRPDVETPEIHAAIEVCQDYLVARALLPVKNDKS